MSTATETNPVLQRVLQSIIVSAEFRDVVDRINRGGRAISISGLVAAPARALVVAALQRETKKQFAIVVPVQRDLESWHRDISFWYCALRGVTDCEEAVVLLPASESDPYAGGSPHAETLERRSLALWRLARTSSEFRLQTAFPKTAPRERGTPNAARATDFLLLTSRALARRTVAPSDIL